MTSNRTHEFLLFGSYCWYQMANSFNLDLWRLSQQRNGDLQVSKLCAYELHYMIKEDWMMVSGDNGWRKRWEVAIGRAFERIDARLKDNLLASYSVGSTALLVILSPCQIIAADVGNSRVVLSCDKDAVQLTSDHRVCWLFTRFLLSFIY